MEKKRDRYIQIRLSENELSMIKSKMAQAGFRRISGYIGVIRALANLENKQFNDFIAIADKKNEKRGAFDEKIFLEKVIESE